VYCNTLAFCQDAFEVAHAREWMLALMRWCNSQPAMVEHNGLCQVHRAEVLELGGAWADALDAAGLAADRFDQGVLNQFASGKARYLQGEIHRLRGEYDAAEGSLSGSQRARVRAATWSCVTPPRTGRPGDVGGRHPCRALRETVQRIPRARLLPAFVLIMLAAGELDDASGASAELDGIAQLQGTTVLHAQAAYATGSVALAGDDPAGALVALRRALGLWLGLAAPYEVARTRTLIALACRALADEDTAAMELDAALASFTALGALADVTRVDPLRPQRGKHGLTEREVQVLRLVAIGRSNREIATTLVISEHTRRQARPEHPGQGRRVLAHCCKRFRAQARPV
jgi:DNA-binding NarL/FixJ family response regulator